MSKSLSDRPSGEGSSTGAQPSGVEVSANVDFNDLVHYTEVPLDESWYDRIFGNCAQYGLRCLHWRVALGRAYYRSKIMAPVSREGNTERRILEFADMLASDGPEPLELAVKFAHKHGVELIAWFPFNETYYFRPGLRNMKDPWYAQHRELFWCDRSGQRLWMGMPCVAEPAVVQRTASIVEELCGYGVDGVYVVHRTHCYTPYAADEQPYTPETDQFGFNEPIRQRFRERHGVDIRREEFDVDAWHKIKGEFYTEFLAACAEVAHRHGKTLLAGTLPRRLAYAPSARFPDALRIYNDWRAWREQAKVDGIVSVQERVRLDEAAQSIPDDKIAETTLETRMIVNDAPGCDVDIFHPVLAFRPAGGGSWSMKDRLLEPVDMLERRRQLAAGHGARSLILHESYMPLFLDTAGKDIGIGACPKMEYWQAIGKWNGQSARR